MAVETAMVVILDHHNPHEPADGCGFSAFFGEEEEEQLLLEARDAELAQELQFQEALRASLIISSSESSPAAIDETQTAPYPPTAPPAENQIPPGPDPDSQAEIKWEAGESSLSFCEICRERKEGHQVVRNVYDENGGCSCVCFDCINVNAGGERLSSGYYEKKGKTEKLNKKKTVANPKSKDHRSGTSSASNRRHFPAHRSPPPRANCPPVFDVELEEKLRMAKEEIRLLRDKIQLQHQESKEAMDFQEQFFKGQIESILEGRVDDDDGGKEEQKEEDAADCNSGTSSVLEPEPQPESLPTKSIMQRIMGEIEKMRRTSPSH